MNKKQALWLCFLLDIVSIFLVIYFFNEWNNLIHTMAIQKPIIIKQMPFGVPLLSLIIPVLHIFGFLSVIHRFKAFADKWSGPVLFSMIGIGVVLIIAIEMFFSYKFEQAGYQYCSKMTAYRPGVVRQAYINDPELCVHTFNNYHLD